MKQMNYEKPTILDFEKFCVVLNTHFDTDNFLMPYTRERLIAEDIFAEIVKRHSSADEFHRQTDKFRMQKSYGIKYFNKAVYFENEIDVKSKFYFAGYREIELKRTIQQLNAPKEIHSKENMVEDSS